MIDMKEEKFIRIIGGAAREDWQARHICLPSLIVAIALHARQGKGYPDLNGEECPELFPLRRDGRREKYSSVKQAVLSHNDYLASWREAGNLYPNWQGLGEQPYYILAVQYLQDVKYPYHDSGEYEKELVELIEKYRLYRYDEVKKSVQVLRNVVQ
ncbi:MAG: hypothetical protein NC314_05265 [Roseburia sp.]|nr:hypothetical protein [Ruminococcus sp.]MCM1156410.1 hypothetical protein [Roseburia sp.]MCM1242230.1 hypothetical protein [Roseburia sp.]